MDAQPQVGQKWAAALERRIEAARQPGGPITADDLDAVLAALRLDPPATLRGSLLAYLELFSKWNQTYNLTAIRDPQAMLTQHLADCLAAIAPLQRKRAPPDTTSGQSAATAPLRLLDVGSGGGLPGVVFAIMQPDLQVTCVDTVGKKAAFLQQVGLDLRLRNLRAIHARVETLGGAYDLITSRAFASLAQFVDLTGRLLAPQGRWMAMKGKRPDDEIAALPASVQVDGIEPLVVPGLDAERCLVWMSVASAA